MSLIVGDIGDAIGPTPGVTCTRTVGEFIADTQAHLMGATGEVLNTLDTAVNSSVTTLSFTYDISTMLGPGRVVAIDDELMYVHSVDTVADTAVVLRGFRGTSAAAHLINSIVEVNPRFPRYRIRQALKDEINSWPDSVFAVGYEDIAVGSARGYDLDIGDYIRVIDTYLSPSAPTTTEIWTRIPYTARRIVPTADFPSGTSITFNSSFTPARSVRVVYARRFVTTDFSDGVECGTIGLQPSMTDIPPLGAAWRLLQGKEVRRLDMQAAGQDRKAEQVQAGVASAVTRGFKQLRDERLQQEAVHMLTRYPLRFS